MPRQIRVLARVQLLFSPVRRSTRPSRCLAWPSIRAIAGPVAACWPDCAAQRGCPASSGARGGSPPPFLGGCAVCAVESSWLTLLRDAPGRAHCASAPARHAERRARCAWQAGALVALGCGESVAVLQSMDGGAALSIVLPRPRARSFAALRRSRTPRAAVGAALPVRRARDGAAVGGVRDAPARLWGLSARRFAQGRAPRRALLMLMGVNHPSRGWRQS